MKPILEPKECNICGGEVRFSSNSVIYGQAYGSTFCYICLCCGAYVGTHVPRPKEAFGILANKEMREMKKKCHLVFDRMWSNSEDRKLLYEKLAKEMNIPIEECHFGFFGIEELEKAHVICSRFYEEFVKKDFLNFMKRVGKERG